MHPAAYVGAERGGQLLKPGMSVALEYQQDSYTDTLRVTVDAVDEATGAFSGHGENKWGAVACNGTYSDSKVAFSMEYLKRPGLFRYYLDKKEDEKWTGNWEHEPFTDVWQHGKAVCTAIEPAPAPAPPVIVPSAPEEA
jgi:hypothetical protein